LESARSGNEEKMMTLLTPLNVNCHASDGRKASFVCEYWTDKWSRYQLGCKVVSWGVLFYFICSK